MSKRRKRPKDAGGRFGWMMVYFCGLLGLSGMIYFTVGLIRLYSEIDNPTVMVPGSQEMNLAKPGEHKIYHVIRKDSDQPPSNLSDLTITVVRKDTQQEIPVVEPNNHTSSVFGEPREVSYKAFTVSEPCTIIHIQ